MLWPCVGLSVASQSSSKMAKVRITLKVPHTSPGTSFLVPNISVKFDRGAPKRGRQMQVGRDDRPVSVINRTNLRAASA